MSNKFFVKFRFFRQSRNKLHMFSLFPLCRKDELLFDIVAKNGNNVECRNNVRLCRSNIELFVERIVRLVAFDNVASTLLLVWTEITKSPTPWCHSLHTRAVTLCRYRDAAYGVARKQFVNSCANFGWIPTANISGVSLVTHAQDSRGGTVFTSFVCLSDFRTIF